MSDPITGLPLTDADSSYGYKPTEYVCIIFVALFGLSTIIHLGQAIRSRMWYLLPTIVFCGLIEILGWSGRLWSSLNLFLDTPFLIQITTTIIAPTPLLAANFVILGRIIEKLGHQYSRLPAKWYTIIFCSADVIALVAQGTGGGLASTASDDGRDPETGGHIILAGIVFQLAIICVYALCGAEFFFRYLKDKPVRGDKLAPRGVLSTRLTWMSVGLFLSTFFLFIRAIYRTIELADGWNGKVINTQVWFNVFDGAMVVLAMYTTNVLHPGVFLEDPKTADYPLQEKTVARTTGSSEASFV